MRVRRNQRLRHGAKYTGAFCLLLTADRRQSSGRTTAAAGAVAGCALRRIAVGQPHVLRANISNFEREVGSWLVGTNVKQQLRRPQFSPHDGRIPPPPPITHDSTAVLSRVLLCTTALTPSLPLLYCPPALQVLWAFDLVRFHTTPSSFLPSFQCICWILVLFACESNGKRGGSQLRRFIATESVHREEGERGPSHGEWKWILPYSCTASVG